MISRKMILGLSLLVSVCSFAGATASADPDCSSINLSGEYGNPIKGQIRTGATTMAQSGCLVTVFSKETGAEWHFDLSGTTETLVPENILKANKVSDLGYKTLSSLRIKSKLRSGTPNGMTTRMSASTSYIDLTAVMTIPDASSNTTVEIEFNSTLIMSPTSCALSAPNQPWECKGILINQGGYGRKTTVRAIGVIGGPFVGPLANVFLAGVNFVLRKADGLFDSFLGGFTRLERID